MAPNLNLSSDPVFDGGEPCTEYRTRPAIEVLVEEPPASLHRLPVAAHKNLARPKAHPAMYADMLLSGRNERRLPIMVVVNLVLLDGATANVPERTYTDNISAHGARVQSAHPWRLGQQAEMLPVKGEPPVRGEVVYCQKLAEDRFFIGLKFLQTAMPWPIFRRYDGVALSAWRDWNFTALRPCVLTR